MNFSFSALMAGFAFGVFGIYMLRSGRSSANFWHMLCGILLLVFPYFVSSALLTWGIGVALLGLAYIKR